MFLEIFAFLITILDKNKTYYFQTLNFKTDAKYQVKFLLIFEFALASNTKSMNVRPTIFWAWFNKTHVLYYYLIHMYCLGPYGFFPLNDKSGKNVLKWSPS